jgi:hypothetical protein
MSDPNARVSAPLASVLASGRAHFNARVAEARHRHPAFDAAAFAVFVRTGLDAVAAAVAATSPDRTASVVMDAYDIALELVAQGLAGPGARSDAVDRAWTHVAPRVPRLLADAPADVLGLLSNAALRLAAEPAARVDEWLATMTDLAAHADSLDILRALGAITAWRAGLVQYRDAALRSADVLPAPLALRAVAADDGVAWASVREAFRADPWWSPEPSRRVAVAQGIDVGRFTGFGGVFAQPPVARAHAQGFVVRSGERHHLLLADAYGAVLLPATAQEFIEHDRSLRPRAQLDGVAVVFGERRIVLDVPGEGLAMAGNEHTVAVTSPYTHAIRLIPGLEPLP